MSTINYFSQFKKYFEASHSLSTRLLFYYKIPTNLLQVIQFNSINIYININIIIYLSKRLLDNEMQLNALIDLFFSPSLCGAFLIFFNLQNFSHNNGFRHNFFLLNSEIKNIPKYSSP